MGGLTVVSEGVCRNTAGVWCETERDSPDANATRAEPVMRRDRQ